MKMGFKLRDIYRRGPGTFPGSMDNEGSMNGRYPVPEAVEADPLEPEPDGDVDDGFAEWLRREGALNDRPQPRKIF